MIAAAALCVGCCVGSGCAPPEDLQPIVDDPGVEARCKSTCPGAAHVYVVDDRRPDPNTKGLWCFCACPLAKGQDVPAEFGYRVPAEGDGDPELNLQLERWIWREYQLQYCRP